MCYLRWQMVVKTCLFPFRSTLRHNGPVRLIHSFQMSATVSPSTLGKRLQDHPPDGSSPPTKRSGSNSGSSQPKGSHDTEAVPPSETPTFSPPPAGPPAAGMKEKKVGKRRDVAGFPKSRKGKEKDGRNPGRKSRRGTRPEGTETNEGGEGSHPRVPRLPKRQCALLIGFCGSGFSGMQM